MLSDILKEHAATPSRYKRFNFSEVGNIMFLRIYDKPLPDCRLSHLRKQ
jgi:hypothetical protein